jgi:hypothetical protein
MYVRLTMLLALLVCATNAHAQGRIKKDEVDYQSQAFKSWWGQEMNWKLADLPLEGKVPKYRIPYSGHDYPDRAGGVDVRTRGRYSALGKYDLAFHDGRGLTVAFERRDVNGHRGAGGGGGGLFGRRRGGFENLDRPIGIFARGRARRTTSWYGHCNGWTAASMRHAEPQKSVVRNGVTFSPADIKGLLAELYMYSDSEFLGGVDPAINPATLHASVTNWLGRGDHPIGMETAVGKVVINYPVYSYKMTVKKRGERQHEVQTWLTYAMNTGYETDKSPRIAKKMFFHYVLDTDKEGKITGGRYYGDSNRIDMLWAALMPTQGGKKGNEHGNPHMKVDKVLAIWRDSVPEELRKKWLNIDPVLEDANLSDKEKAEIRRKRAEEAKKEKQAKAKKAAEKKKAAEAAAAQ